jgi:DNA-binding response OmpR family regulator
MKQPKPSSASRPVVILIEDDSRVAPALSMLIEDWGFDCVAVRTPVSAVEKLGARLADAVAIVVDLSRNDAFTGRRSAEAINGALGTEIPRIVTTNEPALAHTHGFVDVLAKPYDPEDLRGWLLAQIIRASGAQQAGSQQP